MSKGKILFAIIVLVVLALIFTNNTSVAFAALVGSIFHFVIITALLVAIIQVILLLIGKFSK